MPDRWTQATEDAHRPRRTMARGPAVKRAGRTLSVLALIGAAATALGAVYVRWAVNTGVSFFEGTKR